MANGDRFVYGAQGEVEGPAETLTSQGQEGLLIRFPGNKKAQPVFLKDLSREPLLADDTATASLSGVPLVLHLMEHEGKVINVKWASTLGGCSGQTRYRWAGGGTKPIQVTNDSESYGHDEEPRAHHLSAAEFEDEVRRGHHSHELSFQVNQMIDAHHMKQEKSRQRP